MAKSKTFPIVKILKTNVGEDNKINVGDWLAKNGFVSFGWNLVQYDASNRGASVDECDKIGSDFEVYEELFKDAGIYKDDDLKKVKDIRDLQDEPGAFIWIRDKAGNYYVGLIPEGAEWHFANSDELASDKLVKGYVPEGSDIDDVKLELRNRLEPVIWSEGIPSSKVAGSIRVRFDGRKKTLQNVRAEQKNYIIALYTLRAFLDYTERVGDGIRERIAAQLEEFEKQNLANLTDRQNFYACLSPDDTEDLLAMYLLAKKGYVVVPSTNKSGTPQVEFDLFDPCDCGKRVYVQVKNNWTDTKIEKILVGSEALWAYEEIAGNSGAPDCEFYVLQTNDAPLGEFAEKRGWTPEDDGRIQDDCRKWRKDVSVTGRNESVQAKLHRVDPQEVYDFACEQYEHKNNGEKNYLTPMIAQWMDWLQVSEQPVKVERI